MNSPGFAKKMEPAVTSRESVCESPETVVAGVESVGPKTSLPAVAAAISSRVRSIIYSHPASRRASLASSRAEYGILSPATSW